jgi:hypothetical protein
MRAAGRGGRMASQAAAVTLSPEPVLDGVHEDDRATVRNVIYVMHALKLCQSWSVSPKNQGYEVVGTVASGSAAPPAHEAAKARRLNSTREMMVGEFVSVPADHVTLTLSPT